MREAGRLPTLLPRRAIRAIGVAAAAAGLAACASQPKMADEDVRAAISGQTARFQDGHHQSQVEYFSPTGTSYLWFPGNTRPVTARWKVEDGSVCFNYEATSRHYQTGAPGGRWECNPSTWWINVRVAEKRPGDIFDLGTNPVVPFDIGWKGKGFWDLSTPPPAPTLAQLIERYRRSKSGPPLDGAGNPPSPKPGSGAARS